MTLERGQAVHHPQFGSGRVEFDAGETVIVRFDHGLESCPRDALELRQGLRDLLEQGQTHPVLEVIVRAQAETILSINDTWGVFSRSRIALLPHQLWVCRTVLQRWPTRWLVADDVGLGKTIEAGLILWPVLSRGLARRVLILCPASLVEQWQYRLRTLFDLRFLRYSPEADTPRSGFWEQSTQVVASLHTLRDDRGGRHKRLLEAEPWDLVIVDEAHHLNADERGGATLGYRLLDKLQEAGRIRSLVLFSGTPHRGKDYNFLALLKLLRPDRFDPRAELGSQLEALREVMIRNNKQNVTDLEGQRLFQRPQVHSHTYTYSPEEARFYDTLTEFIASGKAYASSLGQGTQGQAVMLVLIAMQKLASSSVAALRRAIAGRLERMGRSRTRLENLTTRKALLERRISLEQDGLGDELSRLEEEILDLTYEVVLMADEQVRLRELLELAHAVRQETKIERILVALEQEFSGRSVLFFTEYKATQSLLMTALEARWGQGCVSFINGDDRAEEVGGRVRRESREQAAERFNAGEVRFLVATEAGGEGIDLQRRCHTLIHVDLPWNPMRLHQRVGRLNRYGQRERVEVLTVRNPDTVEARIWDKLESKLKSIMRAFDEAMDEPEDLLQLVLGMTRPRLFEEVFSEASGVRPEGFSSWFDARTAQFGGEDALKAVRDLVGHSARFDFGQVSSSLPRLDLPDLAPFFKGMLSLGRRQVREDESGLGFKTPEAWVRAVGVLSNYEGLRFDRQASEARQVLGVGHPLMTQALEQAVRLEAGVAVLDGGLLTEPLCLVRVRDRVTSGGGVVRSSVLGVSLGEFPTVLRDHEVLVRLNTMLGNRITRREESSELSSIADALAGLERGLNALEMALPSLELPYTIPELDPLLVLWPG